MREKIFREGEGREGEGDERREIVADAAKPSRAGQWATDSSLLVPCQFALLGFITRSLCSPPSVPSRPTSLFLGAHFRVLIRSKNALPQR